MSYNALRKGRASLVGQAYLVTTVTASRIPLFADLYAGRIIVNAMREQDAAGTTSTLAYVVMPDHVHWLVKLETDASLASVIKQLKGGTARRLNRCANRLGAVWQPSFSRSCNSRGRIARGCSALRHHESSSRWTRRLHKRVFALGCRLGHVGLHFAVGRVSTRRS